ncbi:hypothetical protein U9M48_014698 [Paspalum notatum var. saurae]|uniref:Fatty acyl-CoA reductase n=1 Tax=Paspalum notatum var. saurae TaxID=547442 RepID=A0AAQ3T281_PASNO
MEPAAAAERLNGKAVLITGATGFIAKRNSDSLNLYLCSSPELDAVLVEKILRLQPRVKRLYLLVRARDQVSAKERVRSEIMQLQIFQSLREKYQNRFTSWFWDKIFPVAGDVSLHNLGIGNIDLAEDIIKETNIIIHMVAAVNFRERLGGYVYFFPTNHKRRYDTALAINTMGVKHVLDVALRCENLELVLHVSTAFVDGKKAGIVLEKPLHQYRSYDGQSDLDISEEIAFAEAKLQELVCSNASEDTIKRSIRRLGHKGMMYQNLCMMAKQGPEVWMAEYLCFYKDYGNFHSVIVGNSLRNTMWNWAEQLTYGLLIMVPADSVVNAISCHRQGPLDLIYHIGSSMRNPLKIGELVHVMFRYFSEKPFVSAAGEVIKVKQPIVPASMSSFYEHMDVHYKVPLQDMARRGLSTTDEHDTYNRLKREYNFTVAVGEVFRPVTFFKRRFDDSNMQRLIAMMNERDRELIPVTPSSLIGRSTSWKRTSPVSWNVNRGKQQGLGFRRISEFAQ